MTNIKLGNPFYKNIEKLKAVKQTMSFNPDTDISEQRNAIMEKFLELIKMPTPLTKPNVIIEKTYTDNPRFDEIRLLIETETDFYIPAHLLYPKKLTEKVPLVICLQGHTAGMHISLAREPYPSRKSIEVEGDRDFCIQAISRGYAALALEQRGFGELNYKENGCCCRELVGQATLMGTTLLGERLMDISNAITAVCSCFDFVDSSKIGIMGNSGGGTSAYYAACIDERIKVSMPSSSFCSYVDSWGSIDHCVCAYINNIINYFEMSDLSILIAPRYLVVVNGKYDHLQPFEAAKREFEKVKKIFECLEAQGRCVFVEGPEGHRFYADPAWDFFDKYINE